MELASLALMFLLKHPDIAIAAGKQVTRPGVVEIEKMKESFADLSRGILNCYHRTARYQLADIEEKPWSRQDQYAADKSALIRIKYSGTSGAQYEMLVGVLGKGDQVRTAVLRDTARIPYSKKCQLEQWTK